MTNLRPLLFAAILVFAVSALAALVVPARAGAAPVSAKRVEARQKAASAVKQRAPRPAPVLSTFGRSDRSP